jgi:hypothetical protein
LFFPPAAVDDAVVTSVVPDGSVQVSAPAPVAPCIVSQTKIVEFASAVMAGETNVAVSVVVSTKVGVGRTGLVGSKLPLAMMTQIPDTLFDTP